MIRAQPDRVIGGAPYVWTTAGPEEVDRIFGLVDRDGQPVDGSLAAIGRLYRGDLARRAAGAGGSGRLDCHLSRQGKAYLQADSERGSCS